jgi:GT2 family glycosyltransferase
MVSIIIVNYNLSREVISCLVSLELHLQKDSFNVIVVDNNSTDSELEPLKEHIQTKSFCEIVVLNRNLGFGSACNIGAGKASGDLLCFLNPDTTTESDFLRCLVEAFDSSGCTMIGPVYNEPRIFEFSSGYFPNLIFESLSIIMIGRHLEAALMSLRRIFGGPHLKVDWILGACMLLSKTNFNRLGGFDESFFLYFEEVDLCRRIYAQGGLILVASNCRINHTGSVSGKKDYSAFTERFYQGKLRYLCKQTFGTRQGHLVRTVWLQIQFQKIIWTIAGFLKLEKSKQKIEGLKRAISFYRTFV